MRLLLFSDPHFVDVPSEEYRWTFLEETLPRICEEQKVSDVFCLGDLTDRRDRHSGRLVNRLVQGLRRLGISTLMGNHDAPLDKNPYWNFLNDSETVDLTVPSYYIIKPEIVQWSNKQFLFLPYSSNPVIDWAPFDLASFDCLFMHQTVEGALIERDRRIDAASAHKLPTLPSNVPIYSGDVHRPQTMGNLVYVGTPYPTRFGEDWPGRVLIIDTNNPMDYKAIDVPGARKIILDLNPANMEGKLRNLDLKPGDQVRVRYNLSTSLLTSWSEDEPAIKDAIEKTGAVLLSSEVILQEDITVEGKTVANNSLEELSNEEVLRLFAKEEGLAQDLIDTGIYILRRKG